MKDQKARLKEVRTEIKKLNRQFKAGKLNAAGHNKLYQLTVEQQNLMAVR